ncbi:substrate-binding periplasmic protein [Rugamonas aquatica]|uniref:Transporter substrate-binding domain-containing protein n=1 Tax=Rugamonas aquatica TaxID=2743357 RepID=A0A6A7N9Z1_9BURK|nr:hypothetical protein [Rugamonas aquatica]MQA41811.1 hypothetical protein [Rugamonas aquatica]
MPRLRTIACLLLLAAALPAAAEPQLVRLCQDAEDVYPWTLKARPGLNNILLKIVEARLNIVLEISLRPWKRCQEELKAGSIDGMFAISYLAERQQFGRYPMRAGQPDPAKRLMTDSYSLYRRSGDEQVGWDGSVLRSPGPVGAQRGYSVVEQLQTLGAGVDTGTYPVEDNLRKLAMGRLAAVALRTQEGDSMLLTHREFNGKLEKLAPPLAEKPYYLMLSHQFVAHNARLAQRIWDSIEAVRDSVEYRVFEQTFR